MIQATLLERKTVDNKKKFAVAFCVPRTWKRGGFFGASYEAAKEELRFMRVDADGFPVFNEGLSPVATTEPFWVSDKKLAVKLLQASKSYRVDPEVMIDTGGGPACG